MQTVVAAAGLPPPRTRAPASIFSMADAAKVARALKAHGRFGDAAGFETRGTTCRDGAVVRHVGASYPSNRWDEERIERERERRARQRPPKPVKRARTRGKKVRQWDGEVEE